MRIMLAVVVLGLCLIGVVHAIAWERRHPCLEWRTFSSTCGGGLTCSMYDSDMQCMVWTVDDTYPCTRRECVRRKP